MIIWWWWRSLNRLHLLPPAELLSAKILSMRCWLLGRRRCPLWRGCRAAEEKTCQQLAQACWRWTWYSSCRKTWTWLRGSSFQRILFFLSKQMTLPSSQVQHHIHTFCSAEIVTFGKLCVRHGDTVPSSDNLMYWLKSDWPESLFTQASVWSSTSSYSKHFKREKQLWLKIMG